MILTNNQLAEKAGSAYKKFLRRTASSIYGLLTLKSVFIAGYKMCYREHRRPVDNIIKAEAQKVAAEFKEKIEAANAGKRTVVLPEKDSELVDLVKRLLYVYKFNRTHFNSCSGYMAKAEAPKASFEYETISILDKMYEIVSKESKEHTPPTSSSVDVDLANQILRAFKYERDSEGNNKWDYTGTLSIASVLDKVFNIAKNTRPNAPQKENESRIDALKKHYEACIDVLKKELIIKNDLHEMEKNKFKDIIDKLEKEKIELRTAIENAGADAKERIYRLENDYAELKNISDKRGERITDIKNSAIKLLRILDECNISPAYTNAQAAREEIVNTLHDLKSVVGYEDSHGRKYGQIKDVRGDAAKAADGAHAADDKKKLVEEIISKIRLL
jgi:hypothetical protein